MLAAHDVRVEVVHVNGELVVQVRDDVLAEVRCPVLGSLQEFAHQELTRKDVVAHAGEAVARIAWHFLGVLGLFLEADHASVLVDFDDAEFAGFRDGNGNGRDGEERRPAQVEINHLVDVHLVDVVAAENGHEVRSFVRDEVDVLEDGVGSPLVPVVAGAHLRGHEVNVLVEARVQVPGRRNVLVQRVTLELRKDLDLEDTGIDEIVEDEVDDAVGPAEVDRRLGTVAGEGLETAALAARHDHAQDVFLVFSIIGPAHNASGWIPCSLLRVKFTFFWGRKEVVRH